MPSAMTYPRSVRSRCESRTRPPPQHPNACPSRRCSPLVCSFPVRRWYGTDRARANVGWATVTAEGKLRLDDGSEYSTPTAAARAVGGGSAGLTVWKRTSNGQKLSDVWKAYRLRKR